MSPAISIIIPVYNVERWLDGCMQCVLGQTMQDFEVILVDDGSTDQSAEICDRYAASDSRIRVIHKPNEGSGPTRTRGMLEARGEYLAFPDSDDWFEPTMYADLYALAKKHDADAVFSAACNVHFDAEGNETHRHITECPDLVFNTQEECRAGVMQLFPTTTIFDVPWNKLYRRQIVVDNGLEFRRLRRCQDAVFNLDFYNCCKKVVATSKAYYYYRENTQGLVWKKFPKDYIDIQVFYNKRLKELMNSWGVYSGAVKEHYDTSFVLAVVGCACMYDNPNWGLSKQQQRDYVRDCISRPEVTEFIKDAAIRNDAQRAFEMISAQDVNGIIRMHRREIIKDRLRRITPLMWVFRRLRKIVNNT